MLIIQKIKQNKLLSLTGSILFVCSSYHLTKNYKFYQTQIKYRNINNIEKIFYKNDKKEISDMFNALDELSQNQHKIITFTQIIKPINEYNDIRLKILFEKIIDKNNASSFDYNIMDLITIKSPKTSYYVQKLYKSGLLSKVYFVNYIKEDMVKACIDNEDIKTIELLHTYGLFNFDEHFKNHFLRNKFAENYAYKQNEFINGLTLCNYDMTDDFINNYSKLSQENKDKILIDYLEKAIYRFREEIAIYVSQNHDFKASTDYILSKYYPNARMSEDLAKYHKKNNRHNTQKFINNKVFVKKIFDKCDILIKNGGKFTNSFNYNCLFFEHNLIYSIFNYMLLNGYDFNNFDKDGETFMFKYLYHFTHGREHTESLLDVDSNITKLNLIVKTNKSLNMTPREKYLFDRSEQLRIEEENDFYYNRYGG